MTDTRNWCSLGCAVAMRCEICMTHTNTRCSPLLVVSRESCLVLSMQLGRLKLISIDDTTSAVRWALACSVFPIVLHVHETADLRMDLPRAFENFIVGHGSDSCPGRWRELSSQNDERRLTERETHSLIR